MHNINIGEVLITANVAGEQISGVSGFLTEHLFFYRISIVLLRSANGTYLNSTLIGSLSSHCE